MNLRTITTRLAVAGVSTAVAASALVGAGTVAANAADTPSATARYNCVSPLSGTLPVFMTVSADLPTTSWVAHQAPATGLPVGGAVTIPRPVLDGLAPLGITSLGTASDDFGLLLGSVKIPLTNVSSPVMDVPATGDMSLPFLAHTGAFAMPDAGHYTIKLPQSFTSSIETTMGTLAVPCTIDSAAVADIVGFDLPKQSATMSATAPRSIKKGAVAKIVATVKAAYRPTGKVVAKQGARKLAASTLKGGKATIALKGLKPGKHVITLSYAGDKNTVAAPSVKKTITVKR